MAITAQQVKELREITGAGMMDCKKALEEADADIDKAIEVLREKGLSKVKKKEGRIAAEGLAKFAIAADGKSAAAVEVNSETDFVAKNQEFIDFVEGLAKLALDNDAADMDAFKALDFGPDGTVDETLTQKISKIGENMIKEKKFLFGGRILSNRALEYEGRKVTLSNCYVVQPPEDNIESIFECAKKLARTYSYGGGCGVDISGLSPRGAKINNAARETSGAVSFMMRPLSTAILLEQQEGDTGSASSLINFSNTMLGCIGMIISGFRFFGDIRTLAAILIVFTAAGVVIFAVLMRSDIEIKHLK